MRFRLPLLAFTATALLLPACQRAHHDEPVVVEEEASADDFAGDGLAGDIADEEQRSLSQRMEDVRQIEGEQERIDAANELLAEQQAHADGADVGGDDGYGEENP